MRVGIRLYVFLFVFGLFSCKTGRKRMPLVIPESPVYEQVLKRGSLRVCSYYNTTDYYVYKGVTKGFHYELVKDFADYLGVRLEMIVNVDVEDAIRRLNKGEYDLIAMSLTETPERESLVAFSCPLFMTNRVLVQNRGNKPLVRSVEGLNDKDVFVQKGTNYAYFLQQLNDSLHLDIRVREIDSLTYEDILLQVEHGELPYSVVDGNVARVAARFMPHLDDSLVLSGEVPVAWAVSKRDDGLLQELNDWLMAMKLSDAFHVRYNRYFKSSYVTSLYNSKYYKLKNGEISAFDAIIKREADSIGWDWRLLAAVIYQESCFDPEVVSAFGAYGLMQVMPETAKGLGFVDYESPEDNIHVGTRYLRKLYAVFDKMELDSLNQLKFTLAAYNAGVGHVLDAVRLTEANGYNPKEWTNNVEYFMLLKSNPDVYRDTLCRNGYCDGRQTFNFVRDVFENYTHYQNMVP